MHGLIGHGPKDPQSPAQSVFAEHLQRCRAARLSAVTEAAATNFLAGPRDSRSVHLWWILVSMGQIHDKPDCKKPSRRMNGTNIFTIINIYIVRLVPSGSWFFGLVILFQCSKCACHCISTLFGYGMTMIIYDMTVACCTKRPKRLVCF